MLLMCVCVASVPVCVLFAGLECPASGAHGGCASEARVLGCACFACGVCSCNSGWATHNLDRIAGACACASSSGVCGAVHPCGAPATPPPHHTRCVRLGGALLLLAALCVRWASHTLRAPAHAYAHEHLRVCACCVVARIPVHTHTHIHTRAPAHVCCGGAGVCVCVRRG
jgi:hypothetical protein